ncbi:PEP-CTERM sorting domain-containing protein [Iningainema tapete]|uniref:PEP-CTERM sorting domain-containing protein n=1 Tax=Iningainema tapete BLCC-T55 TaxID=2748662 RepID=A0A8J6XDQ2_9CYAN|nr:PEP-CTERM sorting domain-containing protein [Iningainema tapete]MBD2774215.1 PEP-CTERM sorting domain-containing protein [Iningainema tapete BLCC-T55]
MGIELLGREFDEPTLISIAYSYEQATKHRRPPTTTPPLAGEVFEYQSVPEPSGVLSILALGFYGVSSQLKRKKHKPAI